MEFTRVFGIVSRFNDTSTSNNCLHLASLIVADVLDF